MQKRIAALVFALLGSLTVPLLTPSAQQPGRPAGEFVPGELIVKFRPGFSEFQRSSALTSQGATLIRRFPQVGVEHVRLAPGQSVRAALAAVRRHPAVALAQPNFVRRLAASAPPDDTYWLFGFLWGTERIGAQAAWASYTMGGTGVVVASIDTGVDYTHPDLAANVWRNPGEIPANGIDDDTNGYVDDVFGIDTIDHDTDPMDDQGHGSHTSGTMAGVGNNGQGIVGIAWDSRILACRFIDSSGSGTDAGAIECFNYIVALKQRGINIRVSNNSWGSPREEERAVALEAAIEEAGSAGILNVFAAGNAGTDNDAAPFDPAAFPGASILTVAASNQSDGRPSFSNYGATSVDLAAPGDFILSTHSGSYAFSSGTSMAAPHVAGAAALLASRDPSLSVEALKTLLMQTVDVLPQWSGLVASGGRLNVASAALAAGGNLGPDVAISSPEAGTGFPVATAITVEATAHDVDGFVTSVEFYANDALIGTDSAGTAGVYSVVWSPGLAGSYTLEAVATDDDGVSRKSSPVAIHVLPPAGRLNVALAANGGLAQASSVFGSGYPASSLTNGDRKGTGWAAGGGWKDGTSKAWPDWVEVEFAGPQTIEEIDVFTVQDNYTSPSEPTLDMTFTKYGVRDFVLEYWTGTGWQSISGGAVIDNTRVWRQFHFSPITTSRIRISVTEGLDSYSRLTEIEAYAVLGTENRAPDVTLSKPAAGDAFTTSTPVALEAIASDVDGSVAQVTFHANDVLVATSTAPIGDRYAASWTPPIAGSYTITAIATDDRGASMGSVPVGIAVHPPPGRVNVALAANGGVAMASSLFGAGYPASSLTNGDRKGVQWGSGGGWKDGTSKVWPDWVEVHFSGTQTIEEVDVFTVQDNYTSPGEPTPEMTFTKYGVRDFIVEYWTGSGWETVPGGSVVDNTSVWRQLNFAPVTTSRIRVSITSGLDSYSRLTEIEAYAVLGTENERPAVTLTKPAAGATFDVADAVTLEATATDLDGTVSRVDFYADDVLLATSAAGSGGLYSTTWTPAVAGRYHLSGVATDDRGATRTSDTVTITVNPPPGRVNVALAANGGVAMASSSFGAGYPASSLTNGDRKGVQWGSGGGWKDDTRRAWPDWVEVHFGGTQTIEEVDVFTVQDNYTSPAEPTLDMTFTKYGARDFAVEYWTGSGWEPIPGGSVVDNTFVWRQFNFAPVTTSRIRVSITDGLDSYSRLTEIEAYAVLGTENELPAVTLTKPAAGATFDVADAVTLEATASDPDGTVSRVDFYADGVFLATSPAGSGELYSTTWTPAVAGTYHLTAVATDDRGATRTSGTVTITVNPPPGRVNVALAANGGVAMASSSFGAGYPASSLTNGDRRGVQWGSGGGWKDGTTNVWPDWVEVHFNGTRTIEEVDVFTVQDNYTSPAEPTLEMTFTKYGVRDFIVEYWTGSGWQPVPGGIASNNTNVWRQFNFLPVSTSRIRVSISRGEASNSRLTEIEVYASIGG